VLWSFCAHLEPPLGGTGSTSLDNSTEETEVSISIVINLVMAAYYVGRIWQFVRDARSAMGTDRQR
jgi:hypothetical protein